MLASANRVEVAYLIIRPIKPQEELLWNQLLATHHYLGFRALVGEFIKYVVIMGCSHWVGNTALYLRKPLLLIPVLPEPVIVQRDG